MEIPFTEPWITEDEVQAVCQVVRSGWLSQGEKVQQFERRFAQYIGADHAVATFNGTVALHAQATPVFADIAPGTLCLDPEDVAGRMTPHTAAVVTMHYGGQAYALDALAQLCQEHGLALIEDAAEAHGAQWKRKMIGTCGDAAMVSFTPTKNITCGEGGMITTCNSELAQKLRLLRNHGMDRPYHHVLVGYNYRMTEMQAAIGLLSMFIDPPSYFLPV